MTRIALLRLGLVLAVTAAAVGCTGDNNDVAGSRGALAVLNVDAPSFARSGVEFDVEIDATNVGINNVRHGSVDVTLELPLLPRSVEASSGTTASISGSRVTWNLMSLDSNSQSRLHLRAVGTLAPGEASRSARIRAELTADGITAGEAVATDFVTITP
ncbi:MAG TPA: hypothetical protein VIY96_04330 [Thermoanaerobaculia bacterium]